MYRKLEANLEVSTSEAGSTSGRTNKKFVQRGGREKWGEKRRTKVSSRSIEIGHVRLERRWMDGYGQSEQTGEGHWATGNGHESGEGMMHDAVRE